MRVLSLISQTSLLGMEGAIQIQIQPPKSLPKRHGICFGEGQSTQLSAVRAGRAGALAQPLVFVTSCHSLSTVAPWPQQKDQADSQRAPKSLHFRKRSLRLENHRTLPQPSLGRCPRRLQPSQDLAPDSSGHLSLTALCHLPRLHIPPLTPPQFHVLQFNP